MEKIDDWFKAISNAIEDCQNRLEQFQRRKTANQKIAERVPSEMDFKDQLGFTAPIMIPDSDVSMCQVCPKNLHQLLYALHQFVYFLPTF